MRNKLKIINRSLFILFFITCSIHADIIKVTPSEMKVINAKFGVNGSKRVEYVNRYLKKNITTKVKNNPIKLINRINNFYNKLTYLEDKNHWRKDEYWASLVEFIASGAGDSEDFAMAKLYTLIQYGIDPRKFSLMEDIRKSKYVKIQDPQHIVLVYRHTKNSKLLILDCINKSLKAVQNPSYLQPIKHSTEFVQQRLNTMLEI